jgi:hypothetical protein
MVKQLEACTACGEDTSVGSPFFSDRFVAQKAGKTRYLCSLCAASARGSREVHSDEERERDRERLERAAFAYGSFAKGGH